MKNEEIYNKMQNVAAMNIDFPITDNDIKLISDEIDAISNEHWYWCTFRKSYLICLYGNSEVNNKQDMHWLPFTKNCINLKNFCETHIFTKTTIKPRVIVIRTFPNMKMKHHTDTSLDKINLFEPKIRLVLKGRKNNTLYYINQNGKHIHISDKWRSYIMNGSLLHGMDNQGEEKYTLCWGEPWRGDKLENINFVNFLEQQIEKNYNTAITVSSLGQVDHSIGIKNEKNERIYSWNEWHAHTKN